jgi:opacity protein-like surface antigen
MAQGLQPVTAYGNLGYSFVDAGSANLGAVTGRLGARFGQYLGLEAEGALGVKDDKTTISGTTVKTDLKHSVAAYAVGFFPATPQLDLFARVGYGNTKVKASVAGSSVSEDGDSWNYGGGAQYFLTPNDGIRAEYTRHSFTNGPGHANVWGVSYVRKF